MFDFRLFFGGILLLGVNWRVVSTSDDFDFNLHSSGGTMLTQLITSMYLRNGSRLLSPGEIAGLKEALASRYFSDEVYKLFVSGFERFIFPRLVLQQGQSCDPKVHEKYKNPGTHLFDVASLHFWVAAHLPPPANPEEPPEVGGDVKYCDFRQGLICTKSGTCDCPPGSSLREGEDPRLGKEMHCFIPPMEGCHLINLGNTNSTLAMLLRNSFDYLVFRPDRPIPCAPRTQCRHMAPHLSTPRCWCHSKSSQGCGDATVGWYSGSGGGDRPEINLNDIATLLHRSTVGYKTTHVGGDPDTEAAKESVVNKQFLEKATDKMVANYKKLRQLDVDTEKIDFGALRELQAELKMATKCIVELTEDLQGCDIWTPYNSWSCEGSTCSYPKICYCPKSKSFGVNHWKLHRDFGTECLLEVQDEAVSCEQDFHCHRWDLATSTKGVCSCAPHGYGMKNKCTIVNSTEPTDSQSFLLNFVHPGTVPFRGERLNAFQRRVLDLDESMVLEMDENLEHECSTPLNQKWEETFVYFTTLEDHEHPAEEAELNSQLEKWDEFYKDLDFRDFQDLCWLHKFYYCDESLIVEKGRGRCRHSPDMALFKNAKKMNEKVAIFQGLEASSAGALSEVETFEDYECRPKAVKDKKSDSLRDPVEGHCRPNSFCVEDYESAEFLVKRMSSCELKKTPRQVCRCSETKRGDLCDVVKTEDTKEWGTCEATYLKEKVAMLIESAGALSDLKVGAKCDPDAQKLLDEVRRDLRKEAREDWYWHLYRLRKVMRMSPRFCARSKITVCLKGEDGYECRCRPGTMRRSDSEGNLIGGYCYPFQGSCDSDPTKLLPLFPSEAVEVSAHYGDLRTGHGVEASTGCLSNLCAYREPGEKECTSDRVYKLFVEKSKVPLYEDSGAGHILPRHRKSVFTIGATSVIITAIMRT